MYKIEFYEDHNHKSSVVEFIREKDNKFVILHHFKKRTRKTPRKEIERAKRNLYDYLERQG